MITLLIMLEMMFFKKVNLVYYYIYYKHGLLVNDQLIVKAF